MRMTIASISRPWMTRSNSSVPPAEYFRNAGGPARNTTYTPPSGAGIGSAALKARCTSGSASKPVRLSNPYCRCSAPVTLYSATSTPRSGWFSSTVVPV